MFCRTHKAGEVLGVRMGAHVPGTNRRFVTVERQRSWGIEMRTHEIAWWLAVKFFNLMERRHDMQRVTHDKCVAKSTVLSC